MKKTNGHSRTNPHNSGTKPKLRSVRLGRNAFVEGSSGTRGSSWEVVVHVVVEVVVHVATVVVHVFVDVQVDGSGTRDVGVLVGPVLAV